MTHEHTNMTVHHPRSSATVLSITQNIYHEFDFITESSISR